MPGPLGGGGTRSLPGSRSISSRLELEPGQAEARRASAPPLDAGVRRGCDRAPFRRPAAPPAWPLGRGMRRGCADDRAAVAREVLRARARLEHARTFTRTMRVRPHPRKHANAHASAPAHTHARAHARTRTRTGSGNPNSPPPLTFVSPPRLEGPSPPEHHIAACCGLLRVVAGYHDLLRLVAACCGLLRHPGNLPHHTVTSYPLGVWGLRRGGRRGRGEGGEGWGGEGIAGPIAAASRLSRTRGPAGVRAGPCQHCQATDSVPDTPETFAGGAGAKRIRTRPAPPRPAPLQILARGAPPGPAAAGPARLGSTVNAEGGRGGLASSGRRPEPGRAGGGSRSRGADNTADNIVAARIIPRIMII